MCPEYLGPSKFMFHWSRVYLLHLTTGLQAKTLSHIFSQWKGTCVRHLLSWWFLTFCFCPIIIWNGWLVGWLCFQRGWGHQPVIYCFFFFWSRLVGYPTLPAVPLMNLSRNLVPACGPVDFCWLLLVYPFDNLAHYMMLKVLIGQLVPLQEKTVCQGSFSYPS